MVAFDVHRSRFTPAVVVLIAAFAVHGVAAAEAATDLESQLIDQVQAILSREGPRSPGLLEPLTRLSLLYQEQGDHGLALVTIERALEIVRVNNGLHTLDQVPLLRQKVRSEEARHNDAAAWEVEQDLLTLLRRHLDDLRTVPALREIADRQMGTLHEYLDGEKPPEVAYGCFYQEWPTGDNSSCTSGSRRTVVQGMLAEAQRNYADAISVLLRNELYGSVELRELEMALLGGVNLARSLFEGRNEAPAPMIPDILGVASMEPWRSRVAPILALASWRGGTTKPTLEAKHAYMTLTYYRGRQSLRRLFIYDALSSRAPLEQADSIARIADWDLMYEQHSKAVDGYEVAHAMLEDAGVPAAAIDELFAPATPVVVPAFEPNPFMRDETRPVTGHVDAAFEITKYGRSRNIEVLGAENAGEHTIERVVRLISTSRFRPRPTDGRFGGAARVVVHYDLHD
jgi:hypothetical protein